MHKIIWTILLIQLLLPTNSIAEEPLVNVKIEDNPKNNQLKSIPEVIQLPINKGLHTLLRLLKQTGINKQEVESLLAKVTLSKVPLNAAEQYLLLVIQALLIEKTSDKSTVSNNNKLSLEVIAILEQAGKLSEQVSKQQQSQPEFLQLHLILARHYALQHKYGLAYLEKKSYLKKYYIYRKNRRLDMISSLEKSFELEDKKANNAMLGSQNDLKAQRVEEVKEQKITQQFNVSLIIGAAIIFALLFFRQLILRKKLIILTKTDALTGLTNRSSLFEHGEQLVANFSEDPTNFSILLLDLDHFKKINDNFGHQVGDNILIKVAELVQETMRSRDVFSRLGGEEFVALLPFADSNKAKAIAMRINEKLSEHDFSSFIVQGKVTVSIGVATMENNEMSFDEVLHAADLAMYQAKEQGRNTVVCYQNLAVV
jgi:diguanylate cyclase (GGDEF)-like protein